MPSIRLALASAAAAVVALPAAAATTTITFDDLTLDYAMVYYQPYASGDFLFTPVQYPFDSGMNALVVYSANDPGNADPGGATLAHLASGGAIDVRRVNGGSFTLKSLDISDYFDAGYVEFVDFRWTDAFGDHQANIITDFRPGLQTIELGLEGVTRFQLIQQLGLKFQIDNVVVETGGVPEPSTWAMMILGFGVTGVALRRRVAPAGA